ncbi:hypothetical protein PAXINDRAFT_101960, partial [Paxillus involutus ATCC 200175]
QYVFRLHRCHLHADHDPRIPHSDKLNYLAWHVDDNGHLFLLLSVQHLESAFTGGDCILHCLYVTIEWRC